jgi:hypothetical protein
LAKTRSSAFASVVENADGISRYQP